MVPDPVSGVNLLLLQRVRHGFLRSRFCRGRGFTGTDIRKSNLSMSVTTLAMTDMPGGCRMRKDSRSKLNDQHDNKNDNDDDDNCVSGQYVMRADVDE